MEHEDLVESLPRRVAARPVRLGALVLGGPASLVCCPLVGGTEAELLAEAREVGRLAPDLVEWRADYLAGIRRDRVAQLLSEVKRLVGTPVLVTCRAAKEGGAGRVAEEDRIGILQAAITSGLADMVDVELATESDLRAETIGLARRQGVPVVLSSHYFDGTPEEDVLVEVLARQQAVGADVAKIATLARSPVDGLRLLMACARARQEFLEVPLIGTAMGPMGSFTRVIGPLFGVDLTFAAVAQSSAPGQVGIVPLRQARNALGIP